MKIKNSFLHTVPLITFGQEECMAYLSARKFQALLGGEPDIKPSTGTTP